MVKQSEYCYTNTDILINNLNIKDDNILNFFKIYTNGQAILENV